jgi:hypothetical protein
MNYFLKLNTIQIDLKMMTSSCDFSDNESGNCGDDRSFQLCENIFSPYIFCSGWQGE